MSIVVVAKCPVPGKTKTRLIPSLGADGAAQLARAMLSDVLTQVTTIPKVRRILLFAPSDQRYVMEELLRDLSLEKNWLLWPMRPGTSLASAQLTIILKDALQRARPGPVAFLGMDVPEVPVQELRAAMEDDDPDTVLLCPAADGGYGCLLVPPSLPDTVFDGVEWSTAHTCASQRKVIADQSPTVRIRMGSMLHDVDELEDVRALWKRLNDDNDNDCPHTHKVLAQWQSLL